MHNLRFELLIPKKKGYAMKRFVTLLGIGSLLLLPVVVQPVQGQTPTPVIVTADEAGNGSLQFGTQPATSMPGAILNVLGKDWLFYDMGGPPSLLAGYVLLLESTAGPISDVIQFGDFGAAAPRLGFLFSSDNSDGVDELADESGLLEVLPGRPTATILEGQSYIPTANQPGFVDGFSVTYNFNSDLETVPDAGTTAGLLGLGVASLIALARRTRG
jgi:hypothetical protein